MVTEMHIFAVRECLSHTNRGGYCRIWALSGGERRRQAPLGSDY